MKLLLDRRANRDDDKEQDGEVDHDRDGEATSGFRGRKQGPYRGWESHRDYYQQTDNQRSW